ncbi:hypothetical protein QUA56_14690 [Microcoleus sp. N3A4]|uniref:hypothetical protein n=1 Tax=Microcoleus sp. N3A4 TaxID=3055379 RepID=UPI002FD16096
MFFFIELINASDAAPRKRTVGGTGASGRQKLKPLTLKGNLNNCWKPLFIGNCNLYNIVDRQVQVKA